MSEDKKTDPKAWYEDFHIKQDLQMYYTSYLSRALPDEDAEIYVDRVRNSSQMIWKEISDIGEEIQRSQEAINHAADIPSSVVHKPVAAIKATPKVKAVVAPKAKTKAKTKVKAVVAPKAKTKAKTKAKAVVAPKAKTKAKTTKAEPAPVVVQEAKGIKQLVEKHMTVIIIVCVGIIALTQYFKA